MLFTRAVVARAALTRDVYAALCPSSAAGTPTSLVDERVRESTRLSSSQFRSRVVIKVSGVLYACIHRSKGSHAQKGSCVAKHQTFSLSYGFEAEECCLDKESRSSLCPFSRVLSLILNGHAFLWQMLATCRAQDVPHTHSTDRADERAMSGLAAQLGGLHL
jgi:hypothetical protein